MASSLHFLLLLVALCAIQVPAAVVREEDVARILPQGRAATIITVVTTTATGATTTTIKTKRICAVLEGSTPTNACRRKRQFWNAPFLVAPFFIGQDNSQQQQFQSLNPTQVVQVEPSALPEYRNRPVYHPFVPQQQFASPFAIQPSFEKTSSAVSAAEYRIADPFFGAARFSAFSSLFSNIISSILTPAVTKTSTKTVYTATSTDTSYTTVAAYTLKNAVCLPSGVTTCPAGAVPATTAAGTTTRRK